MSSAEGEQISFLFDCIVRGISPTKGPFGLRPVLPGACGSVARGAGPLVGTRMLWRHQVGHREARDPVWGSRTPEPDRVGALPPMWLGLWAGVCLVSLPGEWGLTGREGVGHEPAPSSPRLAPSSLVTTGAFSTSPGPGRGWTPEGPRYSRHHGAASRAGPPRSWSLSPTGGRSALPWGTAREGRRQVLVAAASFDQGPLGGWCPGSLVPPTAQ